MPVNLSIKNVPDMLADRLRERAAQHHRSLQMELMVLLEESLASDERLTLKQVLTRVGKMGLRTRSESLEMVLQDRRGH